VKSTVSIIVPVYNGRDFIGRLLHSIVSQDYRPIEIIAVDDGSTDGSGDLLRRAAEKLNYRAANIGGGVESAGGYAGITMRVISQSNAGICRARNAGLDVATGEYITFMDQDDLIARHGIAAMCDAADGSDIVYAGCTLTDERGRIKEHWRLSPEDMWSRFRISAPWAKLFRRSFLDEHGIRFMDAKISEDFYFCFVAMSYAAKTSVIGDEVYCWVVRGSSESHKNMSRYSEDRDVFEILDRTIADMNPDTTIDRDCLNYALTKHVFWYLLYVVRSVPDVRAHYKRCISWLRTNVPDYRENPLMRMGLPRGEFAKTRFYVHLMMLMERVGVLGLFVRFMSKL